MNTEKSRAFLAVVLSGLVLFGWQMFFAPKKEIQHDIGSSSEVKVISNLEASKTIVEPIESKISTSKINHVDKSANNSDKLKIYQIEFEKYKFIMTSDLSIINVVNDNAKFDFPSTVNVEDPFKVQLIVDGEIRSMNFDFKQISKREISGTNTDYDIRFSGKILDNGQLNFELVSNKQYRYRIVFKSIVKELENRQISKFVFYGKDVEFETVGDDSEGDDSLKWMGTDFNYHLFAMIFDKKIPGHFNITKSGSFIFDTRDASEKFTGDVVFLMKRYDLLEAFDSSLELSVDFGIFGILAVPVLRGIQLFYKWIPNYGISIILVTILMRLLTFPLQYKSFKSMKKMQQLQPQLSKIKEKYKGDSQRIQKETMEIFKRTGVNPLGGCLPLLLQMPIFFAFYRVLFEAVELVEAPFFGWMVDLSLKDQYYILPILMTVTMFLQQRFTPTSAAVDPTQKKLMMFMPLIFGFIFKDMPAGLCLYILVSTVCGMLQQLIVNKSSS